MTERISTREVTIASHDGKSFGAYLAVPASGRGPGLVLCQEIFGVNDFMRRSAQLLAEEGYVVLVPDLFWRQQPGIQLTDGPADMPRAFELRATFHRWNAERPNGPFVDAIDLGTIRAGGRPIVLRLPPR